MASGPTIGTAYVQIVPTTKGVTNNVSSLLGDEMSKAGDIGGKNLGANMFKSFLASNAVMKIVDLVLQGVQKAVSAIIGFVKEAVTLYGEYEQLAGGAQKIFDQMDYKRIYTDATNAYKELNMSMNDYLESINLVGAAFASTMGDEKGYEVARMGMKAISDYASGTGKSIDLLNEKYQMISRSTSSYQSIADQFSGILPQTSADFLEAAQNAGFLSDSYTKLTEVPVAEYQEALTEMLALGVDQLGLTDNTVKEATNTVTGSIATFQAAWENLKTGLGDPNADIQQLTDNVVKSASAMVENILPVAEQILNGIADIIIQIAPIVEQELPPLIEKIKPSIEGMLTELITIGAEILGDLAPELITAFDTVLAAVVDNITEKHPIVGAALQGLFALPMLIGGSGPLQKANDFAHGIVSSVFGIFDRGGKDTQSTWTGSFSQMASSTSASLGQMSADVTGQTSTMGSTFANSLAGMVGVSSTSFGQMNSSAQINTGLMAATVQTNMDSISSTTSNSTNQAYLATSSNFANMESDAATKASNISRNFAKNLSQMMSTNSSSMSDINRKMSSAWSSADSDTSNKWSNISRSVGGRMLDVMNAVSSRTASMYATLSSTFSRVTSTMVNPFTSAHSQISGQVSGIKGLLNFSWSIPKPKLPHINWHMKNIAGLLSIPVFDGVSWYKKAMDTPYMFGNATLFGAGEAGDEIMYGKSSLMRDIRTAVADGGDISNSELLERILVLLDTYLPATANRQVVLDTGATVGALAGPMDRELGRLQNTRGRGR